MRLSLALFFILLSNIISFPLKTIDHSNDYFIMTAPSWHPGFFSNFQAVVGFLDFYEKNPCAGIKVTFGDGLYFDAKVGPNWWEYYFEPIEIGSSQNARTLFVGDSEKSVWATAAISTIPRQEAGRLIKKYIKLKPHIVEKINKFVAKKFDQTCTIGIHYRGTDKVAWKEAPRVPYPTVVQAIKAFLKQNKPQSYKIFVATDEQPLITYLRSKFPSGTLVYLNALRSSNRKPIHYNQIYRYRQGEESVIDCFLLSRCTVLMKTHSNLSSSAGNINPEIPIINLSHATYCPSLRKIFR